MNKDMKDRVLASLHIILESKKYNDPICEMDRISVRRLVEKAILFHPEIVCEMEPEYCECCGATQ